MARDVDFFGRIFDDAKINIKIILILLTFGAIKSTSATNFGFFDEGMALETRLTFTLINSKIKLILTVASIGMNIFVVFGSGSSLRY